MTQAARNDDTHGLTSINPATGEVIARFAMHTHQEVESRLEQAEQGFRHWRLLDVQVRAEAMGRMAVVLRGHHARFSETITREMGKCIGEAESEIEKCAALCEWMAEHGPAFLADEQVTMPHANAYVSFLPIGTVLGVMPWNFPFWQALRAAVPILLGGNGFLLKHAHNVTGCATALEEAWCEAALPEGVFAHLRLPSADTAALLADRRIAAVTLTGSGKAGGAMAEAAGRARKKSLLELGGSDPFIVLADADIEGAVEAAIHARFGNAGQVCIAAKRFLVEAPVAEAFTEAFVAKARALVMGDPMHRDTQLAPISREDLRDGLHAQVERSIAMGARLRCGGRKAAGKGFFYEPTVLTEVTAGMPVFDEETFGPVAAITVVADAAHAVTLANQSVYGLSANLWTANADHARHMARQLETGGVFVNGFSASDPRVPIGGVKESGYGRELSHFGVREFTNAQTVVMR